MRDSRNSYIANNPDAGKNISDGLINYYINNPDAKIERGNKISDFYKNNEEARNKKSEEMKLRLSCPIYRMKVRLASATGFAKKAGREFSELPEDYFDAKKAA